MPSILGKITATTVSVLAATAGVAGTAHPSPSAAAQKASVKIAILPGIIGPGNGVQGSGSAKWAVIGTYDASKEGKKATLQRKSGSGWVTAEQSKIDKKGRVVFAVPSAASGSPVKYRIDGPGSASTAVSTDRWGTDQDFRDEFGGSKLDLTNWQHRVQTYEPQAKRECSKGDPKAVKVGGGTAQLSVKVDKDRNSLCKPKKPDNPDKIFGKFKYRLNANIGTQQTHSITYGVVAARIKFQPLQGQHASLWMQPTHHSAATSAAAQGTEIDIIEWFGKNNPNGGLTSFIYAPSHGGKKIALGGEGGWIKKPEQYLTNEKDDWFKRFHVFSVEWNPSGYIFRIDGQETGRINKGVSGVPESPILSLLSSDYELSKLPDGDEKKNLPQTMTVDWIRTWQDPQHLAPPSARLADPRDR